MQHQSGGADSVRGAVDSVFFDIDGTLVDSNDAHARSWMAAFAEECDISIAFEDVRPLIGMGADKLFDALGAGVTADSDIGQAIAARRKQIFLEQLLPHVVAFPGARELVQACKDAGLRCVVASSASPEELKPLLEIAGTSELFDHAVGPDETSASKPDPDVIAAALAWSQSDARNAVMIGDTSYDIDAAHRAGVRCIALRCGGSPAEALSGADAVFDTPRALVRALHQTNFSSVLAALAAT